MSGKDHDRFELGDLMVKIGVSYRRSDSGTIVRRIFDRLNSHYGKGVIIGDIDDISPGRDFRQQISESLLKIGILLAIIGPGWLGERPNGNTRIKDEWDPVRAELEIALRRRIPIIPVLIGTARMPNLEQLPSSIKDFAFRNAARVDIGPDFEYHMDRLIKAIDVILSQANLQLSVRREDSGPRPLAIDRPSSGPLPIAALMGRRRQVQARVNVDVPVLDIDISAAEEIPPGERWGELLQRRSDLGRPDFRYQYAEKTPAPAPASVGSSGGPRMPTSGPPPAPRMRRSWRGPALLAGAVLAAAAAYIWRHDLAVAVAPIFKFFGFGSHPQLPDSNPPASVTPAPGAKGSEDTVDVSAFAPIRARVGDDVVVQIFLHVPEARAAAAALAQEADPDVSGRGLTTLSVGVPRGQRVDIVLDAPGVQIDEPSQSLVWQGQPQACQFTVSVSPELAGRTCVVKARVLVASVPVGTLRFTMKVNRTTPTTSLDMVGDAARRYRQAFLSHAHEDRVQVLTYAQLLDAIGISYFQDIASLRTMDDWEPRLHSAIDECDLFLLFWTASASQSEWVERETRYALARQKKTDDEIPDVMPVFLEPEAPRPPDWIKSRHFDSMLRLAMRGAQADLQARRSGGVGESDHG